MNRIILCLVVLMLSLVPVMSWATLKVEADVVKVDAAPEAEEVEAIFRYRNDGKVPVRLTSIEVHCECLGAEADKAVLLPGETGAIRARFDIGDLTGTVRKSITLTTDLPLQSEIPLVVEVSIPELVSVTPHMLTWEKGGAATPQSYEIKILGTDPIELQSANSTRQGFKVEIETVEKGKSYRIHVTPESTHEVAMGAVRIITNAKLEKYRRQLVFFKVAVSAEIEAEKKKP